MRELLQKLRLHGMSKDAIHRYTRLYRHYDVDIEGWKYNMDILQAALLIDQIDEIEPCRQELEWVANYYHASFAGCHGLKSPPPKPGVKQAHHFLTIWVYPDKRDHILWALQEQGVGVAVNYRACHLYTLFHRQFGYREGDFPNAERIGSCIISLPLHASLREEEAGYVADTVKKVVRSIG